jgi:hypothetical protein
LIDLARDYRYKGLSIVGVSMDLGGKAAVESFMSEFHLPYPVLMPDLASPSAPAIDALPTTVLVDRNGRAAKAYVGAVREAIFRADVDRLLAEQPAPSVTSLATPSTFHKGTGATKASIRLILPSTILNSSAMKNEKG